MNIFQYKQHLEWYIKAEIRINDELLIAGHQHAVSAKCKCENEITLNISISHWTHFDITKTDSWYLNLIKLTYYIA